MLNTESRLTAMLIWLAIVALVTRAAWTFFALAPPLALLADLRATPLAGWLWRNQYATAGLLGFGGLAIAYVLNGWRDRAERRHVIERADARLASVLCREAAEIGAALQQLSRERIADTTETTDRVMLSAAMSEFAPLGAGVASAVGGLRQAVRRLSRAIETGADVGDVAISDAVARAIGAAEHAIVVLEAYANKGPAAADRVPRPAFENTGPRALEAPHAPRLLPAA
ncbi:MAG: hypothetical protein JSS20_03300 [Proteobacteria bacterium]|nr:hypothetical protein [Pseudomonadota bacterium]